MQSSLVTKCRAAGGVCNSAISVAIERDKRWVPSREHVNVATQISQRDCDTFWQTVVVSTGQPDMQAVESPW